MDEEARNLEENCRYFKAFLDDLKGRGNVGLSVESIGILKQFRKDIVEFIKVTDYYLVDGPFDKAVGGRSVVDVTDDEMSKRAHKALLDLKTAGSLGNNFRHSTPVEKKPNETSSSSGNESSSDDSVRATTRKFNSNTQSSSRRSSSHHDGRKIPILEKFDEESGQKLEKYFDKFEKHYSMYFQGEISV